MSEWGFLVDENQEPRIAELLREEDVHAEHVVTAVGPGADDQEDVLPYAREEELIIVTNDLTDFKGLAPSDHSGLAIIYAGDRPAHEIAAGLLTMIETYEKYGGPDAFVYDVVDDYLE